MFVAYFNGNMPEYCHSPVYRLVHIAEVLTFAELLLWLGVWTHVSLELCLDNFSETCVCIVAKYYWSNVILIHQNPSTWPEPENRK